MGTKKKTEIKCLCQVDGAFDSSEDGVLMEFDPSQGIFFCPMCGNHLIQEVLEDIVEPSLNHLRQAKSVLLPALKYQILITKS